MINKNSLSETIKHTYGIKEPLQYIEKFLLTEIYHLQYITKDSYQKILKTACGKTTFYNELDKNKQTMLITSLVYMASMYEI